MPTPIPAVAPQDLGPLISLFNSTNGPEWRNKDNWLSDRPLYEWYGLKVEADGRVTEIRLGSNDLEGTLPPELGELDQLKSIFITGNPGLTGPIPPELGRLTKLRDLTLDRNDLTGPIPHELGNLPNPFGIYLEHNRLSGEIPPGLLRNMNRVKLGHNQLTGSIPSDFADDSSMWSLHLEHNQLSGEIPTEIGGLRRLGELYLNDNQLTGEIPSSIGQMQTLMRFSAANNQLSGNIPDELAGLRRLTQLVLDNNRLTGTIPEQLGSEQNLNRIGIAGNDLSGCIPSILKDIEANNVAFANIPVCSEPDRTDPMIPAYVELADSDTWSRAHSQAIELGAQWLSEFINNLGWPAPENSISVYAGDKDGLARNLTAIDYSCNFQCAWRTFHYAGSTVRRGAAFVPLVELHLRNALVLQAQTAARVIFHTILIDILDTPTSIGPNPEWWTDGLATLLSELAVADGMGLTGDEQRGQIAKLSSEDSVPLWELEGDAKTSREYRGGAAIDLLASQVGLRKLTEFYTTRNDGEDWRQTFKRVFNISVADFYERFNQHHRDGYPLHPLPTVGSTDWP